MLKKMGVIAALTAISVSSLNSASALDLESLDTMFNTGSTSTGSTSTTSATDLTSTTSATTATASGATGLTNTNASTGTNSKAVVISNLEVIFNDKKLPADGKSETKMYVRVNDSNENAIADSDVNVNVTIMDNSDNTKGAIKDVTYDAASNLFNVTYTAGTKAGNISFKIEAISKADSTSKLEQVEDFVLEDAPVSTTTSNTGTGSTTGNILQNLDTTETADKTLSTTDTPAGINIVDTKVIDANRIKVTFDKTIFLPDDPLSLVKITKASDNSDVKIANITLSDDKMSLIILTTDDLSKEQYKLAITEVIDGNTKKKISVVNGDLTVTGMNDMVILLFGLLSMLGIYAYRRKKA